MKVTIEISRWDVPMLDSLHARIKKAGDNAVQGKRALIHASEAEAYVLCRLADDIKKELEK